MSNLNTLAVSHKPVPSVADGLELVVSTQRSTKENKIAEEDRYRAVQIPCLSLAEAGVPKRFELILLDALRRAAVAQLGALWKDSTDGLHAVPADIWGVESLLAYAERTSTAERLTGEVLTAWFAASVVGGKAKAKGPKVFAKFEKAFTSLAASARTESEDECKSLLACLAGEDAASWIVGAMVRKLTARLEKLAEDVESISLDDLV
jgi:hypothetical protein